MKGEYIVSTYIWKNERRVFGRYYVFRAKLIQFVNIVSDFYFYNHEKAVFNVWNIFVVFRKPYRAELNELFPSCLPGMYTISILIAVKKMDAYHAHHNSEAVQQPIWKKMCVASRSWLLFRKPLKIDYSIISGSIVVWQMIASDVSFFFVWSRFCDAVLR